MEVALAAILAVVVIWLFFWMHAQRPESAAQKLLQAGRYEEAAKSPDPLHRGQALTLLGRFEEATAEFARAGDGAAAREGLALALAHSGKDLQRARAILNDTIAAQPEIQEFQALALAYVTLRAGDREQALRLFEDNAILLQTRFHDDYTDPDDLLAETLFMYATLAGEAGDQALAESLFVRVVEWAPGSVFARWSARRQ